MGMDFDGSFAVIGKHPTDPLRAKVEALTAEDWLSDAWRQEVYRPHRESNTILLMFDKDYRHEAPTKLAAHTHFEAEMAPIYHHLAAHYGTGYPVRALFARLPPGGRVHPHSDAGFSLTNSHRVHLPVITHPSAWFTIGGEKRALPYGELCEVNNQREHSFHNEGDRYRVHLLVDWVIPGELRFFRASPAFTVHFRLARGAKVDQPLGRPHLVRITADDIDPVELELTREVEPLARWLRIQKGAFTQRDVLQGAQGLDTGAVNDVLDTLVRADVLQHSFSPFPP